MKPLYIIHGWTYSTDPWEKTLDILKSDGFEVKMLHVPGLTTPSEKIFTIDDYVEWADSLLPDDAIVLGHSNGGRILLNLCSKRGRNFRFSKGQEKEKRAAKRRKVILLSSAGVYEPSKKRDILRIISKLGAPLKRSKFLRKVFHKLVGASDYDHAPENMKKTLENMLSSDKNLDLSKITGKVTILWGEKDTVTPLRQGKILHEKIKGSTLKTFPNWTHAPYISDPEGLARALEEILREEAK